MINIKQLKYFITCADAGSFSEAASVLYTTQSSVSKVIRSLEEEMQAYLYPGGRYLQKEGKQLTREAIENLHYIQNFLEDTGNYEGWKLDAENNLTLGKIDVSVVTNSDYIMEKMLDHGNLANISGDSLNPGKTPSRPGICLTNESGKIMFGYVKREKTPLSDLAMKFLNYVKQELIG